MTRAKICFAILMVGGLVGKFLAWAGGANLLQGAASHPIGKRGQLESMPYTSAEIPPAGAPSGFDCAAIVGFSVRCCTVVPLRSE